MKDPTPPPPTQSKRASPKASPEFAQARIRRDIRLLDERRSKLFRTFEEKKRAIDGEREKLCVALQAVNEQLGQQGSS